MKRALVLLSGCGNMDGSEIHESVSAIIALSTAGWEIIFTAPEVEQRKTVSYLSGKDIPSRNALEESARIARGNIEPLSLKLLDEADALVIPGGFGAALTLCDFGIRGSDCQAIPEVSELLGEAHRRRIPIAAMCIAPALVARCIPGVSVTLGNSTEVAAKINGMGCTHIECPPEAVHVDNANRIVSTPAYMTAKQPSEVFRGAQRMVEELDRLCTGNEPDQVSYLKDSTEGL